MVDKAMEHAEKMIREIGSEDYVLRNVLAAAFRAGEAEGHAAANRIEVSYEAPLNAPRGL